MSKVMIAIPCMDQVPTPFMLSMAMIQKPSEHEFVVAAKMGSLIYNSRNDLATQAILGGFNYVLWLDSDMVFQPDLFVRLKQVMDDNDLDILSGLYFRRTHPFTPVLYDHLEVTAEGECEWSDLDELPDHLFECGGCGFGGVLIKTSVLATVREKYIDMFTPVFHMGEDLSFCWRARQCGFKVWVDPGIELGHVGYSTVNRQFYDAYKSAPSREE